MKYQWFRTCAFCGQGRLLIMKDTTHDRLYLHCEECEYGWFDPEDAVRNTNSFLTLLESFDARPATDEEIVTAGWGPVSLHSFTSD